MPSLRRACFTARCTLPEHLSVKEQNGVQGLVLGAGRHVSLAGQVGEELFELLFARKAGGQLAQRHHVAAEPEDMSIFGGQSFVLSPDDLAQPADGL